MKLDVPSIADPRWEKVSLKCEYNLDGMDLYSVKWYKDGVEFFRFMPGSKPAGRDYPIDGVFVDVSRSDSQQVTLLGQANTRRGATSIYKRELQSVTTPVQLSLSRIKNRISRVASSAFTGNSGRNNQESKLNLREIKVGRFF